MNIQQLIDKSDLKKHDKISLNKLYRQYRIQLEHLPVETQLHELIHYFRGDHLVQRDCAQCYIHNLIADYQVEQFIQKHWKIDRSEKINKLISQLQMLKLIGELRDLLHWECSSCPFREGKGNLRPKAVSTMNYKSMKLQYTLEQLIRKLLPKIYVGITHRNYTSIQKRTHTMLPSKQIRKQDLNIIVDTSTSIPLVLVQTVIDTVMPFLNNPYIRLYGFSDICYKITSANSEIRYKDITHFKPVHDETKNCKYNIVITDLQFDDFTQSMPKNYKVIGIGSDVPNYNLVQVI